MTRAPNLFEGFRPMDLRHSYAHALAEYIAQTQHLVDSLEAARLEAERILAIAERTLSKAQADSAAAKKYVAEVNRPLQGMLKTLPPLVAAIPDMVANLVGSELQRLGSQLAKEAKSLKLSAEHSARSQAIAAGAEKSLRAYERDLSTYEQVCFKRASSALALAYRGSPWWRRLQYVFVPPQPLYSAPKKPLRPNTPAK